MSRPASDAALHVARIENERLLSARELFLKVENLVTEALALLEAAKAVGDRANALRALREARETLNLLGRAQNYWGGDNTTTIDLRQQRIDLSGFTDDELRKLIRSLDDRETMLTAR